MRFRFLLADIQGDIYTRRFENHRQILFGPTANTGDTRPVSGLQAYDLNGVVLLFKIARYAHNGTGGTHGADKVGDFATRLPPYFRAGGAVVGQRVIRIGKLVERLAFTPGNHGICDIAGLFHAAFFTGRNQLSAVGRHGLLALGGSIFRHNQGHVVPF